MDTLAPPAAVVFDWDNTLVDTWPVLHRAVLATLRGMGHAPWSYDQTCKQFRHGVRDAFSDMFGDRAAAAERVFYAALAAEPRERLQPVAGAESVLDACAALGLPLSIVSNKRGPYLRGEVDALGWAGRFAAVVGAGDAPRDKPDPAPVHAALRGGCVGPDVWFVGDTPIDVACARAAGCSAVLVDDSGGGTPDADLHLASCTELADHLHMLVRRRS